MKLQNSDYFDSEDSYWEEVAKIRKKYSLEPSECGEFVEYVQATIPYHNPNIPIQEVEEELEEYFYKELTDDWNC